MRPPLRACAVEPRRTQLHNRNCSWCWYTSGIELRTPTNILKLASSCSDPLHYKRVDPLAKASQVPCQQLCRSWQNLSTAFDTIISWQNSNRTSDPQLVTPVVAGKALASNTTKQRAQTVSQSIQEAIRWGSPYHHISAFLAQNTCVHYHAEDEQTHTCLRFLCILLSCCGTTWKVANEGVHIQRNELHSCTPFFKGLIRLSNVSLFEVCAAAIVGRMHGRSGDSRRYAHSPFVPLLKSRQMSLSLQVSIVGSLVSCGSHFAQWTPRLASACCPTRFTPLPYCQQQKG